MIFPYSEQTQGVDRQLTTPSLTDMGLCYTINGQAMAETFKSTSERLQTFVRVLDGRNRSDVQNIVKSGPQNKGEYWLNVREVCSVRTET